MKRIDPAPGDALTRVDSGDERFLSRWSRLKRASRDNASAPAPRDEAARAPESTPPVTDAGTRTTPELSKPVEPDETVAALPPVESLTIDSDYSAFFQPKVPESLRRAAVKKLFADPHFNVMDGLDTYIDDYTKPDPIPEAMLRSLNHAKGFFAPMPDPLERHRGEMLAEAQAQAAPAGDGQPLEQDAAPAGEVAAIPDATPNDAMTTDTQLPSLATPAPVDPAAATPAQQSSTEGGADPSATASVSPPATVSSERS